MSMEDVSQEAEPGIAAAAALRGHTVQWLAETRTALDRSNTFIEKQGLLLDSYRRFQLRHGNEQS